MCLAYDIGCCIFYQDTDSMHVFKEDLPKLEESFRLKYNRELRSKNLGQFHSDFHEVSGGKKGETPRSIDFFKFWEEIKQLPITCFI